MINTSNIITGLVMTILGVVGVKYTFQLVNITGSQDWIERFAGPGTTYGIYKLFSVVLVLIGILIATGFGNPVMEFLFSPLKGLFSPLNS
jgi:hypothetical protein